jgi:hypothetical protein
VLQPSRRTVCSGQQVCLVPVEPLCWTGRSWPILEEIRKEQANRRQGLLISFLHVEYYRVPPGMRSSLCPSLPQYWGEWEAKRGMNNTLPAGLVYPGSSLLQGDPLRWCIFRTEWVIAFFSKFVVCSRRAPSRLAVANTCEGHHQRRDVERRDIFRGKSIQPRSAASGHEATSRK